MCGYDLLIVYYIYQILCNYLIEDLPPVATSSVLAIRMKRQTIVLIVCCQ